MRPRFSPRVRSVALAATLLAVPAVLLGPSHASAQPRAHIRPRIYNPAPRSATVPAIPNAGSTNVDASLAAGPQSETAIVGTAAYSPSLVAGSNDITLPDMDVYTSLNGGQTWKRGLLPPSPRCGGGSSFGSDPVIASRTNGVYFYGYISVCGGGTSSELDVAVSFNLGQKWIGPIPVVATAGNTSVFQDKPEITVDNNSGSPTNGRVYMTWDEAFPNGQQHIELSWSDNYGFTWHAPVQVDVNGSGGVIYADPVVSPGGRVAVIWNDYGADASGKTSLIEFAAASNTPAAGYVPAFSSNTTLGTSGINLFMNPSSAFCTLNAPSGTFCLPAQPDRGIAADPSVLSDSSGKLYALWTQGKSGSAVTDVELQTSTNGGATWSAPVQVNDDNTPGVFTSGASDFFPWGAIDPATGALHVTFYSSRLDATRDTVNVYDAVSTNGGASFSANAKVTDVASNESATNSFRDQGNNYGDYEQVTMQGGKEHPVWTDTRFSQVVGEEVFTTSR